ncbi:MAG: hypothetical protein O2954_16985, partial [bacterium]|nr:hypothetical protein [bacterium]
MSNDSLNAVHALNRGFFQLYPDEAAKVLDALPAWETVELLEAEPSEGAVEIFSRLNPDVATKVIEQMDRDLFRNIFTGINPVRGAMLLTRVDTDAADARLRDLPAGVASELRELMSYPADSAGSLMDPRATTFRPDETVEEALTRIRTLRGRRILDLCVATVDGYLTAVVPLQEVASA